MNPMLESEMLRTLVQVISVTGDEKTKENAELIMSRIINSWNKDTLSNYSGIIN